VDANGEEFIMAASKPVTIQVAVDSGCVDHIANLEHLPDSVKIQKSGPERNFVDAQKNHIEHYGTAKVRLELESGKNIMNNFQVGNVCRPLHSMSKIADEGHDLLVTKKAAHVVPEGVVETILAQVNVIAEYPRRGGLYVATMLAKDPELEKSASASFARQEQGR
jgi:hypothetical protein